jgi:hypothetical protein
MSPREKKSGALKWIACGCLGCAGLVVIVVVGFFGLIGGAAFTGMKSNDAYKQAMARASHNPQVVEALGEPVKAGFFVSGSVNVSGPSGSADLSIPVSGPLGKGTLFVVAEKSAGLWQFSTMDVAITDTGERIDLLDQPLERVDRAPERVD